MMINYSKLKYRPEIDGLRALAVSSVVIFHLFPNSFFSGGFIGVDIFFVISGFIITSIIYKDLKNKKFSYKKFIDRRIRRIFPSLLTLLIILFSICWFSFLPHELSQLGKHIFNASFFHINFSLVKESGYFDSSSIFKPLLHLWSLSIEEQFYLTWPFALIFIFKKKINIFYFSLIILTVSFLINISFFQIKPTHNFYYPFGRVWELLAGCCLSIYLNEKSTNEGIKINNNLYSFIGLLLIIFSIFYLNSTKSFPGYYALLPVIGTVLIIYSGSETWVNKKLFSNKIIINIGLISYPLYLFHWSLISIINIYNPISFDSVLTKIYILISTIIFSIITYFFIEKPLRFHKSKYISLYLTIALLIIGIGGLIINKKNGVNHWNNDFQIISDAFNDWEHPNDLIKNKFSEFEFFTTSEKTPSILFFGDSHIEQYSPRVVYEYKNSLTNNEIVFLTGGGCAPIPNLFKDKKFDKCHQHIENFKTILNEFPINKIVISANFNDYIGKIHDPNQTTRYYLNDNGKKILLSDQEGLNKTISSFIKFIKELSTSYEVTLILDNPRHNNFSPENIIREDGKRPVLLSKIYNKNFNPNPSQYILENLLISLLETVDVKIIKSSDIICPKNNCNSLVNGKPIYKDSNHLRPWFVIDKFNFENL